jgi:muconolactone D-isomerase
MAQGKLRRIWRVVGGVTNISIWQAETLEEMHANLNSLPLYPYMKETVTPLIEHPGAAAWKAAHGEMLPF